MRLLEEIMILDGIIFDLDGTLWSTSRQVKEVWQGVMDARNIDMTISLDMMDGLMGMTPDEIADKVFSHLPHDLTMTLLRVCSQAEVALLSQEGGDLYPNVMEVLINLSQTYPLYIVSNCQDGYIECFLNYHQTADYFKDFECIGRTGLAKADNISLLMERNNLRRTVYIGDTLSDQEAANQAGIPFIQARYGFGNLLAGLGIDCLQDLPGMVKKLEGDRV